MGVAVALVPLVGLVAADGVVVFVTAVVAATCGVAVRALPVALIAAWRGSFLVSVLVGVVAVAVLRLVGA